MTSRTTRQRLVRRVANLFLVVGGLILAFPFWSAAYARIEQGKLTTNYDRSNAAFAAIAAARAKRLAKLDTTDLKVRYLASVFSTRVKPGDPIGRLVIPRIHVNKIVLQGYPGAAATLSPSGDASLLRSGPVHYATTPLPGMGEPFAVAGHRTTYGAPFYRLNELRHGDSIALDTPYARFAYRVDKVTTTLPNDTGVLADRGYALVLTTCTPPYSASHRLIVWATLAEATPK
jgi:sortase A